MGKGRLEAFSDGVIAIIITIMVLELKQPDGVSWDAVVAALPHIAIYALSFLYVGIYWNNHHHLFQVVKSVNGAILWANLHLLFWLSLLPFASAWMGETHFAKLPVALYGGELFLCAISYIILVRCLIKHNGQDSLVARAIGHDFKSWTSQTLYVVGIGAAFFVPAVSVAAYAIVAMIWLIPDRRIERVMK